MQRNFGSANYIGFPLSHTLSATTPKHYSIGHWIVVLAVFLICLYACTLENPLPPNPVASPTSTAPVCASIPNLTPTPQPPFTPTQKHYNSFFMQYYTFLRHKQFQQAYAMLSTALHARLSFNEFKQSMHYVLSNGCWALYQIVLSQVDKDGRTWDVGIEMACGSCAKDKNTVVWYDWEFQMIMEQHQTVIDFARIIPTLC